MREEADSGGARGLRGGRKEPRYIETIPGVWEDLVAYSTIIFWKAKAANRDRDMAVGCPPSLSLYIPWIPFHG